MSQVHVYFLPSAYGFFIIAISVTEITAQSLPVQNVLNGTAVTDLILIHFTQCTQTSTFTKPSALYHSSFCYREYPTQSLQ